MYFIKKFYNRHLLLFDFTNQIALQKTYFLVSALLHKGMSCFECTCVLSKILKSYIQMSPETL